jgi:hypothetical protein
LTVIEGVIRFPAGIALSDISGIVRLENVSLADAPSMILAATRFAVALSGQPIAFRLSIGSTVDGGQDYILSAEASAIQTETGKPRKFGTRSAIVWRPGGLVSGHIIDLMPWT